MQLQLFYARLDQRVRQGFLVAAVLMLAVCANAVASQVRAETQTATTETALSDNAFTGKTGCSETEYNGNALVVCRFDVSADIRLFLNNEQGEPFGHFNWVNEALAKDSEQLIFAMNAGMYHEDRSPVGLYIESGDEATPINTNDGPGNFHLKPNGVLYVDGMGVNVLETSQYFSRPMPGVLDTISRHATQSGPMLVIGGEIHPRFIPASDSRKRRNGVGVSGSGDVVYFVLADTPINFYDFAAYFHKELKTPNALYLDGTISRLYAPELNRNDPGVAMGPIIGIVAPLESAKSSNNE